jgi:hypothetical protein
MKFRRMACDCCKTSDAPRLCQGPTYVMSEVADNSNVIFVLISKRGRTACGGPLAISRESAGYPPPDVGSAPSFTEPRDSLSGRAAEAILAGCRRPTYRLAGNDDFEEGETPIRRNQRLLEEGSGFWPRVRRQDRDGALREWE